jgi:hypothetical protein
MYKLHIPNEHVRSNVAVILEALKRQRKIQEERQKTLTFAIDLETGMLHPPLKEKKEMLVDLHLDLDRHQVRFHEKEPFILEKKAQHLLAETCHQIELAFFHIHSLGELIHLEFEPSLDEIKGREMLHAAWYAVEREDAERFLLQGTPGTYLFRKDRFAGCLEEILATAKKARIKCYTLTYLDASGQVRDKTMVHWSGKWMFYDDDPTLSGDQFRSLEDLLKTVSSDLKRPLQAIKVK